MKKMVDTVIIEIKSTGRPKSKSILEDLQNNEQKTDFKIAGDFNLFPLSSSS